MDKTKIDMQELEKILEEIGELRGQAGSECTSEDHYIKKYIKKAWEHCLDRVVGIIRKHMNDGWIPVNSYGFPSSSEHDFRFWVTVRYKNGFRRTLKATWNYFDNHFVYQNGKMILEDVVAYRYYSAPDPYRLKQPDACKYTGGSCCWPIDQCSDCPNNPERSEK